MIITILRNLPFDIDTFREAVTINLNASQLIVMVILQWQILFYKYQFRIVIVKSSFKAILKLVFFKKEKRRTNKLLYFTYFIKNKLLVCLLLGMVGVIPENARVLLGDCFVNTNLVGQT